MRRRILVRHNVPFVNPCCHSRISYASIDARLDQHFMCNWCQVDWTVVIYLGYIPLLKHCHCVCVSTQCRNYWDSRCLCFPSISSRTVFLLTGESLWRDKQWRRRKSTLYRQSSYNIPVSFCGHCHLLQWKETSPFPLNKVIVATEAVWNIRTGSIYKCGSSSRSVSLVIVASFHLSAE